MAGGGGVCKGSERSEAGCLGELLWTPHQGIVTTRDSGDCIRVLLYSYYSTVTGWGVHLKSNY